MVKTKYKIKLKNLIKTMFSWYLYINWLIFDLNKFKKIKDIKSVLIIFEGKTIGDFYQILGVVNKVIEDYDIDIYMYVSEVNKKNIKNPKIKITSLEELKVLTENNKIDSLICLSPFKHKEIYKKIPIRIGIDEFSIKKLFKEKTMPSTVRFYPYSFVGVKGMLMAFKKLGFEVTKTSFYYLKEGEKYAEEFYKDKKKKIIFIHIGGGKFMRVKEGFHSTYWNPDNWIRLSEKLIETYDCNLIFTGTKEEKEIINNVVNKIKNKKNVLEIPCLPIEHIASLLKRGDLLISIDTGIAHIGVQTGIPIICLFGPFNPKLVQLWSNKKIEIFHKEGCTNCMGDKCKKGLPECMSLITPEEILNSSKKILKGGKYEKES